MKNKVKTAQSAHRLQKASPAKPPPCQRAFAEAQRRHVQYPLTSGGIYKLREALKILHDHVRTVRVIEQIVLGELRPTPDELIGNCVAAEKTRWLKSVPKQVADTLGCYVPPAIEALGGDHLPKARVQKFAQDARAQVDRIVSRCDEVSEQINRSIELEYQQMRSGKSMSAKLLEEAISFVGQQIGLAEKYRLTVVRPPAPAP